MPIQVGAEIRQLGQQEYSHLVYEVMRHVFDVHNDLGRFFDERIYQREIAFRVQDAQTEVPINVSWEDFHKTYFIDLLVAGGAVFELKAVESLAPRHRAQLLHYLFLTGLSHGKLVNMRSQRVEHEFVNATLTRRDRTSFTVADDGWQEISGADLKDRFTGALCDWGTGLDLGLYEDAAAHFCRPHAVPVAELEIRAGDRVLGIQPVHLAAPDVALKLSAVSADHLAEHEAHLRRFLAHTSLRAIQWINISRPSIRFATVR